MQSFNYSNFMFFKDKVVLITGAGGGIGRAITIRFAKEKAKLALNDIFSNSENLEGLKKEIEENEIEVEYFLADISKQEEVEKMIEGIQKRFGRLDILINNAGIIRDRTLAKMTLEEWKEVIETDLNSVFYCSKATLPLIIANQGTIINISSVIGQRGNFGQANYAAAKAGIIGFTKSLAKEVGRFGVRVNALAPGFIETKMTENLSLELKEGVKRLISLGRFGKPEEVANLVAFLASEEATYITGAVINIDGGLY